MPPPSLVGIGLTDLPKPEEPPAPSVPTALNNSTDLCLLKSQLNCLQHRGRDCLVVEKSSLKSTWTVTTLFFCLRSAAYTCGAARSAAAYAAPHQGSKWVKPAKNISIEGISRVFSSKLRQIHIISISGHCKPFVFKICRTVAGITMMCQFHEFFFN